MKSFLRGVVVLICMALVCAVWFVCLGLAQETASPAATTFQISGVVKNGKTPLPGVTVTAANTLTGKKVSVATGVDGLFVIKGIPRGRYVVKIEFMGFATVTQEVVLNPENTTGKVEAELVLASRQQEEQANRASAATTASRGFQNLAVQDVLSGLGGAGAANSNGNGGASGSDLSSLPMNGAGAEIATESVSIAGAQGRSQDFGSGSEEDIQQRIQEFRDRAQREGNAFGGPGGGMSGPGGPGMAIAMGRLGRGFNINQPHGFLYFQDDNAAFDAQAYSLSGQQAEKASYNQIRFGAFVGGPMKIPGLFDWGKSTFYSVGWNGTRGSTPYDAFSTVPTVAERSGDFSGLLTRSGTPVTIYDPTTGLPFANNSIDPSEFSSAAVALLPYIPLPNVTAGTQNFHYITSDESDTDSLSLRLIHNFIAGGGPGFGPVTIGSGGGGGGRGGGRRGPRNNLNVGFNWSRTKNALVNPFPLLAGSTNTQGWNGNVRWTYGKGRVTNSLGFNYNHNRASTTNLYSEVTDVAGNAGITGISTDPFDWGLPGISFSNFAGFSGPIASRELDQTYAVSDTLIWNRGKHNWRFGGDYRRILQGFRSARNAEGSFLFTGFATAEYLNGSAVSGTGYDFADFLLGLPQQTSLQSGTTDYEFRANSYDFYAQDDWRLFANLSLNLGLRYEYSGPFSEIENRIANLDVSFNPASVTGIRVLPGQSGPYDGVFPATLVRPDRNNWAPRVGLAWRWGKQTVVRAGYGINYNLAQYGTFIRNFAFQPPFANTQTNSAVNPSNSNLTLIDGFPNTAPGAVTNNYALDPNYRLGYVQIWNVDLQRQLPGNVQLNVGYNGAKGTRLDTERALVPTCASSTSCQASSFEASAPFVYESSEGNSILHAGSVRVRKRMSKGLGLSASYVFSKSIDDASSIGDGATVVAQNPFDLPAERGLSSFDQKHKFTGNWIYDLPFGDGRRFLTKGALSHLVGGWQWSGDFTIASGFYFTPRILGSTLDATRGVSGSLRGNYVVGQPIGVSNPTTSEWFNTAAFCTPGALNCAGGTTYGNAGRNIIEGPAQFTFDMTLNKTITIKESRSLELRLQASNIFNTPYFSAMNTSVGTLTFGQVTGVGNMRRITMVTRFRF